MTKELTDDHVKYFLGCEPKELKQYLKIFPDLKEPISQFLDDYKYNYYKKKWISNNL